MFNGTVQWPYTLYPLLKSNGYDVGYVGKWHAPMPDDFRRSAFDYFNEYYGSHLEVRDGVLRHVTDLNNEDSLYYLRKRATRKLRKNLIKKFALTVAFFATHSWDDKKYPDQYVPQNYTERMYDGIDIPEPKTGTEEHWNDMPWFFTEQNEARVRWHQRYDTPERYQVTMKRYYRMASEVDDVVGNVVKELKRMGVYNKTLLVFTTDNGMFHGEHQLAGKWYPHEESVRVPLVIQDPRMPDSVRGTTNDDFTLNIDLAPTLLSAAGIEVPPHMQGRDIADLYLNDDSDSASLQNEEGPTITNSRTAVPWRRDFFYEWTQGDPLDATGHDYFTHIPAVFGLVSKEYKYFYWPQTKYEQIFRVSSDPYEEEDIFNATLRTDRTALAALRGRYAYLKSLSQSGHPV